MVVSLHASGLQIIPSALRRNHVYARAVGGDVRYTLTDLVPPNTVPQQRWNAGTW